MVAKAGGQHHLVVAKAADQAKVLQLLAEGIELSAAVRAVGKKPEIVLRRWLAEPKFAAAVEEASAAGSGKLDEILGGDRRKVGFEVFSKEFLNSEVFPHHKTWVDVLEGRIPENLHPSMVFNQANPRRLLVNVPPEHAKSTVLTVGYSTYRICMDPNVRIAIISQTQKRAKEFLYAIKQRLTEEPWLKLQQAYGPPEGWKATSDQWTKEQIYLQRSSGEKDPTVQALGWGSQVYGARLDLIILDDIVDTSNAHRWQEQMEWLQKMVVTRLGKTGVLVIAGTRVAPMDFYKSLLEPENWSGGKTPFTYLGMPAVLEFADKPEDWVTLWPKSDRPWDGSDDEPDENGHYPKWDGRALFDRRSEISAATWALVYQQQDVEEDAVFPAACVHASVNRMRKPGPLKPGIPGHPAPGGQWVTLMGLDPAMTGKTAAVMYAVERNTGDRLVLDAYNMSDPTPQKIRALMEEWVDRYHPMELRIEINAHQKAYALDTELNQWLASRGVALRQHYTGRNKWDTAFGVAAMSALFGSLRNGKHEGDNILTLPSHEGNEHLKALINQLITWKADTKGATDLVMALWFCEIRARELVASSQIKTFHATGSRWTSKRNSFERQVVNLDDMFMEQHNFYQ